MAVINFCSGLFIIYNVTYVFSIHISSDILKRETLITSNNGGLMHKYIWILLAITLVDVSITSFGIYHGHITEKNPIMAWYIKEGGLKLFIAVKIILTFLGIAIFETLHCKKLISSLLREQVYVATILLYLAIFSLSMVFINETSI